MTDKTLGQQLDDKLSELVTRDDLNDALRATAKEIITAVNVAIEGLRVDLNKAGVPVRTATRGEMNQH